MATVTDKPTRPVSRNESGSPPRPRRELRDKQPEVGQAKVTTSVPVSVTPNQGHAARRSSFFRPFSTEKALILFGFAVATLLFVLFGLDLVFAWPFKRASVVFDVGYVVGAVALGYLSWNAQRDQMR